jgi:hypothetical protein
MIPLLREGDANDDVRVVQQALNRRDPKSTRLKEDGIFGPKTRAAVVNFQKQFGCDPDGIVGPQTRSVLFPLVTATTTVKALRLQSPQLARGNLPPGGQFGTATGGGAGTGWDPRLNVDAIRRAVDRALSPGHLRLGEPGGPVESSGPGRPGAGASSPLVSAPSFSAPSSDPMSWILDPIPVPRLNNLTLPAPRLSLPFGFRFDSVQAQTGISVNLPPLDASGSTILVLQSVWTRGREDGPNTQFTIGTQFGGPLTIPSQGVSSWTLQWFTQFTWADPFWHFGRLHLVQPFAQFSGQYDFGPKPSSPTYGIGLFPLNIGVDLRGNDVGLFFQGGLSVLLQQYQADDGAARWRARAGPAIGLGLTFKLPGVIPGM